MSPTNTLLGPNLRMDLGHFERFLKVILESADVLEGLTKTIGILRVQLATFSRIMHHITKLRPYQVVSVVSQSTLTSTQHEDPGVSNNSHWHHNISSHLYNLLVKDSAPLRVPRGPTGHNAVHAKKKNQTCENEPALATTFDFSGQACS